MSTTRAMTGDRVTSDQLPQPEGFGSMPIVAGAPHPHRRRQGRSSSLRCGRSTLTPAPSPGLALAPTVMPLTPDPADAVYLPSHDPTVDVLYRLVPLRARLWDLSDFDGSQQRWHA